MFTGIIEHTPLVVRLARRRTGAVLTMGNPWAGTADRPEPRPGESISVNGACLTVVSANENEISFDMSEETMAKTNLSKLTGGSRVNVERALRIGDDISGHFVSGHIDGTGRLEGLARQGEFAELSVALPGELLVYVVPKGSIAVEGVSLTVASLERNVAKAAIIPETLARTTLGGLKEGAQVNIEVDIIGRHVVGYLRAMGGASAGAPLTLKDLEKAGY